MLRAMPPHARANRGCVPCYPMDVLLGTTRKGWIPRLAAVLSSLFLFLFLLRIPFSRLFELRISTGSWHIFQIFALCRVSSRRSFYVVSCTKIFSSIFHGLVTIWRIQTEYIKVLYSLWFVRKVLFAGPRGHPLVLTLNGYRGLASKPRLCKQRQLR